MKSCVPDTAGEAGVYVPSRAFVPSKAKSGRH
jgi:hypothetical protein